MQICSATQASRRCNSETLKLFYLAMSANSKKSIRSTIVLILMGIAALYGGPKTLALLIPAALLVWYGARPILRSGRN